VRAAPTFAATKATNCGEFVFS